MATHEEQASSGRLVIAVVLGLLVASSALAHGPTVTVAYAGVKPATLTIRVGETVHFKNGNSSGAVCTVVIEDGSSTSRAVTRAQGWHHTFERAGRFPFQVKEMGSAKGVIVVVAE